MVSTLSLLIVLLVAIPAAYVIARYDFPGRNIVSTSIKAGLFINVSYIVVPIFLMLLEWNTTFQFLGDGLFLNNRVVLAVIYASTALPFTIYLLSSYFQTLPADYEDRKSVV